MAHKKSDALSKAKSGETILSDAAVNALEQILKLAESDSTDSKTKYDIYKWICEMHFGKPTSSSPKADSGEKNLVLAFTGELDKWSK